VGGTLNIKSTGNNKKSFQYKKGKKGTVFEQLARKGVLVLGGLGKLVVGLGLVYQGVRTEKLWRNELLKPTPKDNQFTPSSMHG